MNNKRLSRMIQAFHQERRRKRRIWASIGAVGLALSLVVMLTLVVPGLTNELEGTCPIPEHQHDEDCFRVLDCDEEIVVGTVIVNHTHSDECLYILELDCELDCEDDEGYAHSENCYGDRPLNCEEETLPHVCMEGECFYYEYEDEEVEELLDCAIEDDEHDHDESCEEFVIVINSISILIEDCQDTGDRHVHEDDCYGEPELLCTDEVRAPGLVQHTDDCYKMVEVECEEVESEELEDEEDDEEAYIHEHDDDCYIYFDLDDPQCGLEEHEHDAECQDKTVVKSISGSGTIDEQYVIGDADGLAFVAEQVNAMNHEYIDAYYVLGDDIDLSSFGAWTPIGTKEFPFDGVFNGDGYTVSGLYINDSSLENAGLFGYVKDGTIQNIGLIDANVTAKSYVGGLVGYMESGTVSGSYVTGNVSSVGNTYAGGLIGYVENGTVSSNYTVVNVSGQDNTGGLIGYIENGEVSNVYAGGKVAGVNNTGGLIGYVGSASVKNTYALGEVIGSGNIGGIAGFVGAGSSVKDAVALNLRVSGSDAGRIAGEAAQGTLDNNYAFTGILNNDFEPVWDNAVTTVSNGKDGEDIYQYQIADVDFWIDTANFDETVWETEYGFLPILNGIGGQDGTIPARLRMQGRSTSPLKVYSAVQLRDAFRNGITSIQLMNDIVLPDSPAPGASAAASPNASLYYLLIQNNDMTIYGNGHTLDLKNNTIRSGDYDLTLVGNLEIISDSAWTTMNYRTQLNEAIGVRFGLGQIPAGAAWDTWLRSLGGLTRDMAANMAVIYGSANSKFTIQQTEANAAWELEAGDTVNISRRLDTQRVLVLHYTHPFNASLIEGYGQYMFEPYTNFNGTARTNRINQNRGTWQTAIIRSMNVSKFHVMAGANVNLVSNSEGPYSYSDTRENTHGITALILRRPTSTAAVETLDILVDYGATLDVTAYGTGGIARAWAPMMILNEHNAANLSISRNNRAISRTTIYGTLNVTSNNGNALYYQYIDYETGVADIFTVDGGYVNLYAARRLLTDSTPQIPTTLTEGARLDLEYAAFEAYGRNDMEITVTNGGKMDITSYGCRGMSLAGGGLFQTSTTNSKATLQGLERGNKNVIVTGAGSELNVYGLLWAIAAENYPTIKIEANSGGKINLASAFEDMADTLVFPGSTVYTVGTTTMNVDGAGSEMIIEHRGGSYGAIFADGWSRDLLINVTNGGYMDVSSANSGGDRWADRATITAQTSPVAGVHHWIRITGPGSTLRVWNENTRRGNDSALYPRGAISFAANAEGSILVENGGSLYARNNNLMSPTIALGGYSRGTSGVAPHNNKLSGQLIVNNPGDIDIRNDADPGIIYDLAADILRAENYRNPVALRMTDYLPPTGDGSTGVFPYWNELASDRVNSSQRNPLNIISAEVITVWPMWNGSHLNNMQNSGSWTDWDENTRHNRWFNILNFNNAMNNSANNSPTGNATIAANLTNMTFVGDRDNDPTQAYQNRTWTGSSTNRLTPVRERNQFALSDYGRIAIRGAYHPGETAVLSIDKKVYEDSYVDGLDVIDIDIDDWTDTTEMDLSSQALFKIVITNSNTLVPARNIKISDVFDLNSSGSHLGGTWYNGSFAPIPAGSDPTQAAFEVPAGGSITFYFLSPALDSSGEYKNTASIAAPPTNGGYLIGQGSSSATVTIGEPQYPATIEKLWGGKAGSDELNEQVVFVLVSEEGIAYLGQHTEGGKFTFSAPEGIYDLYEVSPEGYMPKGSWSAWKPGAESWLDNVNIDVDEKLIYKYDYQISLSADGNHKEVHPGADNKDWIQEVNNLGTGPMLPETGGAGTDKLFAIGAVLTALSGAALVVQTAKKRRG